ncbi:hypothetical protein [Vulcanisaeta sp. JCM 16161]|uniref:hypothetical protein n=1 Tax=Vulcanisaeta sp. JCM 16161 TaxID=1295372 RepID=UPI00406C63F2
MSSIALLRFAMPSSLPSPIFALTLCSQLPRALIALSNGVADSLSSTALCLSTLIMNSLISLMVSSTTLGSSTSSTHSSLLEPLTLLPQQIPRAMSHPMIDSQQN